MDLIMIALTIAIVGVIVYLILQLPMPAIFKQAIQIVAIVFILIWLLSQLNIPNVLR